MIKTYTSPSDLGLPPLVLHKCSSCNQPMECYHVLFYTLEPNKFYPNGPYLEGLSRCNNTKCRDTGWYGQMRLRFKNNEVARE